MRELLDEWGRHKPNETLTYLAAYARLEVAWHNDRHNGEWVSDCTVCQYEMKTGQSYSGY